MNCYLAHSAELPSQLRNKQLILIQRLPLLLLRSLVRFLRGNAKIKSFSVGSCLEREGYSLKKAFRGHYRCFTSALESNVVENLYKGVGHSV